MIQIADYPTTEFTAYFKAKYAERGAHFELFQQTLDAFYTTEVLNCTHIEDTAFFQLKTEFMKSFPQYDDSHKSLESAFSMGPNVRHAVHTLVRDPWLKFLADERVKMTPDKTEQEKAAELLAGLKSKFPNVRNPDWLTGVDVINDFDVRIMAQILRGAKGEFGVCGLLREFFEKHRGISLVEDARMNHYFDFFWMLDNFVNFKAESEGRAFEWKGSTGCAKNKGRLFI